MSSWLPSRARWSLGPGPRLFCRGGKTRGRKAGAQEPRWCSCHEADLSAAGFPPTRCSGSRPFRFPRESGGPGAAVGPLSGSGPQRSGCSAGAVCGFLKKDVTLRAAEVVVGQCPSGRHPVLRGPWIPAFAGKTMREIGAWNSSEPPRPPFVSPAKAGAQEPRWCRCHEADLSAVGFPPVRCSGSFENQHPPCRGALGGSMSSWLPSSARWSLGPGPRLFCRGGKTKSCQPVVRGPWVLGPGFLPGWENEG